MSQEAVRKSTIDRVFSLTGMLSNRLFYRQAEAREKLEEDRRVARAETRSAIPYLRNNLRVWLESERSRILRAGRPKEEEFQKLACYQHVLDKVDRDLEDSEHG